MSAGDIRGVECVATVASRAGADLVASFLCAVPSLTATHVCLRLAVLVQAANFFFDRFDRREYTVERIKTAGLSVLPLPRPLLTRAQAHVRTRT